MRHDGLSIACRGNGVQEGMVHRQRPAISRVNSSVTWYFRLERMKQIDNCSKQDCNKKVVARKNV